ncbi:unnamed protein product [Discula destructiva]
MNPLGPPPPLPPRPPGYEIWQPPAGTTWNYVLHHPVRLDHTIEQHAVWIIDLFDTPTTSVQALHARGRKVIAYFSAGTYEDWRPDAARFPPAALGRKMDDWAGERWLLPTDPTVQQIMRARLDLAVSKGFDGVDPDNVDGWDNKNGLKLTRQHAVDYVHFLAREAHARGLSVGLKNAGDIVPRVLGCVQWAVNEQAVQFGDEEQFLPFIKAGKPVFHVEYPKGEDPDDKKQNDEREVTGKKRDKCMRARTRGFSTVIKNVKLDQWVQTS